MLTEAQRKEITQASISYAREGKAPKNNLLCPERLAPEDMISLSSEDVFFLLERFCKVEYLYAKDSRLFFQKHHFLGYFPYFFTLLRQQLEKDANLKKKVGQLFLTTLATLEEAGVDESIYFQPRGRLKTTLRTLGLDY